MASHPSARPGGAPLREARAHGEGFARSPQFEWLARAGLVARGVVYLVIGVLAIKLALGEGGKATKRTVVTGQSSIKGEIEIRKGLIGGEDLIVAPSADLKDGDKVHPKA